MSTPAPRRRAFLTGRVGGLLRLGLLAAIVVFFAAIDPDFLRPQNIYALFQSFALLGLLTLGLSLTMIAGEFDLSVGSMVAVAGLITVKTGDANILVGVALAAAFGLLVGLANAAIFAWLKVSSLVVTVGTMMTLSGLAFLLAGGRVISMSNYDAGALLDNPILSVFSLRSLITVAAFIVAFGLMRLTRVGRDIVATGSKRTVATASGARVGVSLVIVFCLSGFCAAVAGSLLSISLATASATMGANLMLQGASAAIIGGVALSGGVGGPLGVLTGVLILTALNNGLSLLGTNAPGILFANGLVLLVVVLLDGRLASEIMEGLRERRMRNAPQS
jgi:ribose/xylose/arabinose/galactoside ABC-type transport system permease subunit